LEVPAEVILKILEELASLRKEIESLKGERSIQENKASLNPVFHSLSMTKSIEEKRKEQKQKLDPLLEKAADMAIKHFNAVPPKRTGGGK